MTSPDTTIEIRQADGTVTTGTLADLDAATDGLFDGAAYDTPVPKLNGHRADVLKIQLAGGVEIDLMLTDHVEWFKSLRFGQELELTVHATVAKHTWALKTNTETGEEKATHTLGLTVHSIDTPEGL